ncbi:uncharacterized protein RJT20DRAFT_135284 [Scheffersomyces xylosifermentans]|uniref:uncharacterized protein n=1 Tax=Scheffersomyces xylosifermentans TaxID=1304137 RepID=UPI00315DCB21
MVLLFRCNFEVPISIQAFMFWSRTTDIDYSICDARDIACICDLYFTDLLQRQQQSSISESSDKHQILQGVRNLRIFGKCFLGVSSEIPKYIGEVEKTIFPMFSQHPPNYVRWNGEESELLFTTKYSTSTTADISSSHSPSFWRRALHGMSGRGIVVSVGESQVDDVRRLIKVLRFLGNELPIQIVHKGDLSPISQDKIVKSGRGTFDKKLNALEQEIWFVDSSPCLSSEYFSRFTRYRNKWLPVLFSSFEEIILMDADTVPVVNPTTLLSNPKFERTGALFFKDRALLEKMWSSEAALFKSLFPSQLEQILFGMEIKTKGIFENTFFKLKRRHLMESGVVVINRKSHLSGLLMGCHLHMWSLTSEPVHGDKELFWLGQLLSGNTAFEFSDKNAGAIGKLHCQGKIKSICSTQVAHFSDDGELLWINGGLSTCKKDTACYDYSQVKELRKEFSSCESLDSYYKSPITAQAALIVNHRNPSALEKLRPSFGWTQNPNLGCLGYFWCAKGLVENVRETELILFNNTFIEYLETIANVW